MEAQKKSSWKGPLVALLLFAAAMAIADHYGNKLHPDAHRAENARAKAVDSRPQLAQKK